MAVIETQSQDSFLSPHVIKRSVTSSIYLKKMIKIVQLHLNKAAFKKTKVK